MNKSMVKALGFHKEVQAVEESKCPVCSKKIEPTMEFTDELSLKEFYISGLCQRCQDEIFG